MQAVCRGPLTALLVLGFSLTATSHIEAADAIEVYARGDYSAVVKLLEPKYRDGTARIQERILLARAYIHLGNDGASLPVLGSVLKMDSENPDANSLTGQIHFRSGKHKEAVPYLEHGYRLKQDPVTASALGHCYYALGEPSWAKFYLEKALEKDIRDPANSYVLGKIFLERGSGTLAEKHFLAAQEAGMESQELHLLLGRAYVLERKLVGPVLTERMTSAPQAGTIVREHVVLGLVEGPADQYKLCTRYCALYEGYRLLEKDPGLADAIFMVASGWLQAGDTVQADKYVKMLSGRERDTERLLDLMARVLLAARDFPALDECISQARARKILDAPTVGEFYYRAALVLRGQGEFERAVSFLKKAEGCSPASGKVLRSLAELSALTGQRKEGAGYYARIVELFPDAPDIGELRNRLKFLQEKVEKR